MLFLALRSASLKSQSFFLRCALLLLKTKALFALCSASLKTKAFSCAALCFSEKPKLSSRCALLL